MERLQQIRRCREFFSPIDRVRELRRVIEDESRCCTDARTLAHAHLEQIRAKLRELRALERDIAAEGRVTINPQASTAPAIRVLVLCTRNSARSQMAEALFATIGGDRVIAASAGSDPGPGVHPRAVEALAEIGIDWRDKSAQGIPAVQDRRWDAVITVCDAARDACSFMPTAGLTAHWGLEDPATAIGDHAAQLQSFRVARDLLRDAIIAFFATVDRARANSAPLALAEALVAGERVIVRSPVTTAPDSAI